MRKNFVLDTNICLSDANNLFGFADNNVILTGVTMQEINKKKNAGGEAGFQARECARILEELGEGGGLAAPVDVRNGEGGTLQVLYSDIPYGDYLPGGYDSAENDNRIIAYCRWIQHMDPGTQTILVTSDRMMRIHAAMAGVAVESYRNEQVETTRYTGHRDMDVPAEYITDLYKAKSLECPSSDGWAKLLENEFVTLRNGKL